MFFRFNNGTSLKSSDKNFSKAVSPDKITALVDHPIFEMAMTENVRQKLSSRKIVINSYIMLSSDLGRAEFISRTITKKMVGDYVISWSNIVSLLAH